ncbi:MAG TPA: hypothetical protein VNN72_20345 [Polyangiaceae bacterium]|nr:hypothetical protein [Polyangiaceae bacterium]
MRPFRILPLTLILAFGIPACSSSDSGDDDSSGNQTGSETPGSTSAEITAADGGDVVLGKATLSIPGGALAEDTTVTVESSKPSSSLPDASSLAGLVYDLGPTGTEFSEPVALTLPLPAAPGAGKEAVIAYLNEDTNAWEDLTTTVGKDGASADISHFSRYVIRIRNTNVEQPGGEVECSFTACGGDPTGTWQIATACLSGDTGSDDPFGGKCDAGTVDVDVAADGTLVIEDGRYTWDLTVQGNVTFNIPASCVDPLGGGQATSCDDFAGDSGETTCTGSLDKGCACTQMGDQDTQTSTGTLEIKGNQFIGTEDGEEPGEPSDYCVKGNSLKIMIHESDDDGSVKDIMMSFTK